MNTSQQQETKFSESCGKYQNISIEISLADNRSRARQTQLLMKYFNSNTEQNCEIYLVKNPYKPVEMNISVYILQGATKTTTTKKTTSKTTGAKISMYFSQQRICYGYISGKSGRLSQSHQDCCARILVSLRQNNNVVFQLFWGEKTQIGLELRS